MENSKIAEQFKLLSKVMDLHGENVFKIRTYANAAFAIEKYPLPLVEMQVADISSIKGIGEAVSQKIQSILQTGHLPLLDKYVDMTPPGVLEMLQIKGLGPKKIVVVWKEMGIEDLGELLYACNENRLTLYKGFGAKTQESIRQAIEFYLSAQGFFLYKDLEKYSFELLTQWKELFGNESLLSLTGDIRRQCTTLGKIALVISKSVAEIIALIPPEFVLASQSESQVEFRSPENILIEVFSSTPETFARTLFSTTGSETFLQSFQKITTQGSLDIYLSSSIPDAEIASLSGDETIFMESGFPYVPACMREWPDILTSVKKEMPKLIQPEDIRGIIHAHSDWSDGKNTIMDMAKAAQQQGFEYLVMSDHSQSAFYANGLKADRIHAQHEHIAELNDRLAPFRIFKSIESDILPDGSLDYPEDLLSTFDMVIASVHSNLKMDQQKAMHRLLKAIENPFTTILGHPTGRLLLSRPGYPVDHIQLIEACVKHRVVIEINAHPRRLDLDWSWIPYALEKGALLSIDPDAHAIAGLQDVRYGVLAAQKGGLTADRNLSCFSLTALESYLQQTKPHHI